MRPIGPGTIPNDGVWFISHFDERKEVKEARCMAWGYFNTHTQLTPEEVASYELVPVLHVVYEGRDSFGRCVYEDEYGNLWKNPEAGTPREVLEQRGDRLYHACGNKYEGEPDSPMRSDYVAAYVLPDDRQIEVCEGLGWFVSGDCDGTVSLQQHSPAGEDFEFSVDTAESDFVEEVKRYAADFDIDEHIEMWIEAKHNNVPGVPSARELVRDAEAIDGMLQALAATLAETVKEDEA